MGKFIKEKSVMRFNNFMISSMISSITFLIVGILMMVFPAKINSIFGYVVGTLILVSGINAVYKFFARDGAKLYSMNLLFGLIKLCLGIVIIVNPFSIANLVSICLGIYLIIAGANKVTYGVWLKIGNHSSWFITLVIGLMLAFFGILFMIDVFDGSGDSFTKIVGTFFTLYAVLDLTSTILLKRRTNEITKIFW